jgi:hypothetical protein
MVTSTTTPRKQAAPKSSTKSASTKSATAKAAATKASATKAAPKTSATSTAAAAAKSAGFDFSKFAPRNLDLPDFMTKFDVPGVDAEKLFAAVRDAAYITVGFGVLAVQQANARRQDLAAKISETFSSATTPVNKAQIESMIKSFEAGLAKFDDQFEARLETTIGKIEGVLPAPAGDLLTKAHGAAKSVRQQVRSMVLSNA